MKKNLNEKMIKNESMGKLYIFYNVSKDKGIKRMRSLKQTNIQLGEIVKINNELYILLQTYDPLTGKSSFFNGDLPKDVTGLWVDIDQDKQLKETEDYWDSFCERYINQ